MDSLLMIVWLLLLPQIHIAATDILTYIDIKPRPLLSSAICSLIPAISYISNDVFYGGSFDLTYVRFLWSVCTFTAVKALVHIDCRIRTIEESGMWILVLFGNTRRVWEVKAAMGMKGLVGLGGHFVMLVAGLMYSYTGEIHFAGSATAVAAFGFAAAVLVSMPFSGSDGKEFDFAYSDTEKISDTLHDVRPAAWT